ncbi:MAG: sulfur oxidation c-type cytochrome SoxX [Gammaproteobacteria bacterium]|nr:MAG: sulfur oxidation c-type cytochrome SoxX [Gammaproteobacteria bacterium]
MNRRHTVGVILAGVVSASGALAGEDYVEWKREGYAIPRPLAGLEGDAVRGRALVVDRAKGNCLACHRMPIPEEEFQGTVGPPLYGVASRLNEGELRLRVVDEKQINPATVMPGYYRDPKTLNRVADDWWGRTILSAQEVEDVVAYLKTLDAPGVPQQRPAAGVDLQSGPVSGSAFLSEVTRQMQEDDFANPGMTTVEYGRGLFHKPGEEGTRCVDCHGEEGEGLDREAIARYPRWNAELERPITLQEQINICWEERMDNFPYVYDCRELVGLETYVRYLARGQTIAVQTDGPVRPFYEEGERLYRQHFGQLDMSCYHCHDQHRGA